MANRHGKHKGRNRKRRFSTHHRKCRSNGGLTTEANCVRVDALKHECWHALFENHCAEKIAEIINLVWLDPEWELVAIKKGEH